LAAPDGRWKYDANRDNVGEDESYNGPLLARFGAAPRPSGELLAWDPAARKAAWRAPYPVVEGGGVLATAGNLVFQGRADGVLAAWRATDGKLLWTFDTGTGIMAPPVTYMLDGVQYVSVLAGWGGPSGLFNGPLAGAVRPGYGRILAFKLGGTAALPARPFGHAAPPESPTAEMAEPALVKAGGALYGARCARCHGWNAIAGPLPDLRYSSRATLDRFEEIVLGGSLAAAGMPSFRTNLNAARVRAIRAFVMARIAESGAK
jgi:mono/diheme cytochrome c family protein